MKRNLLSVLILVLLIVNIAMTAVMMISVIGANKKTAEFITEIAGALHMELYSPGGTSTTEVPISDTETYRMEKMTIPLANRDGSQKYIVFTPSLLQNTKHKDYKKMGGEENMKAADSIIRDIVNTVVGRYTLDEWKENSDGIREEILKEVQTKFGSTFIYQFAISDLSYG